jgi:predicted Zn-dependent protease
MTIQLDFWHIVSLVISFVGASAGAGKLMLSQMQRHLEDRFKAQEQARMANHEHLSRRLDAIELAARSEGDNWQRVERDFLRWQAEMPIHYVRREDYVRGQSIVEAKLDGLAAKIDNVTLRAALEKRDGTQ